MSEKKLRELLTKYLEGKAMPTEERLIDLWYDSLSWMEDEVDLPESEKETLRSTYWKLLSERILAEGIQQREQRVRRLSTRLVGLAASVVSILMIALLMLRSDVGSSGFSGWEVAVNNNKEETVIQEICNESDVLQFALLADGSKVRLFPGSTLQLDQAFNVRERKIHLSGQAFFDISPNEDKPFYVFANEVVTKVLGTSFIVTAFPGDSRVTVAVKSGKVSVYAGPRKTDVASLPDTREIVLTPNQQAVYTRIDQKVSRTLVEDPEILMQEEEVKKIRFEGMPASEVFEALGRMYGVDILFEEEIFSRCSITTSTVGKDLYERIDVICEITGSTYVINNDAQIIISGAGCN